MKKTQIEQVMERFEKKGFVDNYWAIDNYVTTRLGAYICDLRKAGWKITTKRGFQLTKCPKGQEKNTFYYYEK